MTLDEHFRDQIRRGQPPLVALDNAAQAYAKELNCPCKTGPACKPTCTCKDGYQSGGCDRCHSYTIRDFSQYTNSTEDHKESEDNKDLSQWRILEKGEIIQFGDEMDQSVDPCHDVAKWEPVSDLLVGKRAPDPSYPSHRTFRRRVTSTVVESQYNEAVELLREQCQRMQRWRENGCGLLSSELQWHNRVRKFLEGK